VVLHHLQFHAKTSSLLKLPPSATVVGYSDRAHAQRRASDEQRRKE